MAAGASLIEQLRQLEDIDEEYRITLRVLAIVTERYLEVAGASEVIIDADALNDPPDLDAIIDETHTRIRLAVSR